MYSNNDLYNWEILEVRDQTTVRGRVLYNGKVGENRSFVIGWTMGGFSRTTSFSRQSWQTTVLSQFEMVVIRRTGEDEGDFDLPPGDASLYIIMRT